MRRKRAEAFRPRISPWVRAPGCTRGESGRLAPRRPKRGQERKRLGEPVHLFLRDNQTCPRNVRTVFTLKQTCNLVLYVRTERL